jgi:rare lipoprotein A
MNTTAKIRTLTPALVLMAFAGWGVSLAATAPEGSTGINGTAVNSDGSGLDNEGTAITSTAITSEGHAVTSEGRTADDSASRRVRRLSPEVKPILDRSGRRRIGKASFYAKMFAGRTMADGTRMEPTGNNAASLTLPLGTTAKVTNLETGKTAVVTIRDRGPYVAGRIVDLSPATAREIGLDKRTGVTKVEVAPIAVPMPDGEIKLGDGVLQASNRLDGSDRLGVSGRIEMRSPR